MPAIKQWLDVFGTKLNFWDKVFQQIAMVTSGYMMLILLVAMI